jgi:formylglycine-generating enzyme required for sulfatase activity
MTAPERNRPHAAIVTAASLLAVTLQTCLSGDATAIPPPATATDSTLSPAATETEASLPLATPTALTTRIRTVDGMTMSFVPAGAFLMGGEGGDPNEQPPHRVFLEHYWIDQTEITNVKYALCVAVDACESPEQPGSETRNAYFGDVRYEDYPVIYVNWSMASAYCGWAEARLPTEAEWEKAARSADARIFPWGDEWDVHSPRRLNFSDTNDPHGGSDPTANDGFPETAPVASFEAGRSPYGLYDMAGNVWEWVADFFDPEYYQQGVALNPTGPLEGELRSVRGGSWVASQLVFRTFNRNGIHPSSAASGLGFRCAASP